jgi:hypothetical protein
MEIVNLTAQPLEIYTNIFSPLAHIILDFKLYEDRTVKTLLQSVAAASNTPMAKKILSDIQNIPNLSYLSLEQKRYIFTYWYQAQIQSRIFVMNNANLAYLAYNGQFNTPNVNFGHTYQGEQVFHVNHNFINIRPQMIPILPAGLVQHMDCHTFVELSGF